MQAAVLYILGAFLAAKNTFKRGINRDFRLLSKPGAAIVMLRD